MIWASETMKRADLLSNLFQHFSRLYPGSLEHNENQCVFLDVGISECLFEVL